MKAMTDQQKYILALYLRDCLNSQLTIITAPALSCNSMKDITWYQ